MKPEDIKTSKDAKEYITKCIDDFESGITSKNKTILNIMDYGSRMMYIGLQRKTEHCSEIIASATRCAEIF